MKKLYKWVFIAVILVSLILGISIAFRNQTALTQFFQTDDAFYYFQVAKNIADGKGITFDGIVRANGYHPLWMIVCVPVFFLARFDLWLPLRVLVVIQAFLHAGTGFYLYRTLVKKLSEPVAILAAAFWLFNRTTFLQAGTTGLETGINMFCVVLLFYSISTWENLKKEENSWKYILLSGMFATLTLMARLDNIYVVCFLGAWVVLKHSGLDRRLIFIDFFFIVAVLMFSYLYYLDFSDTFFNVMPEIKIIIVSSMVMLPLGQFATGVYHTSSTLSRKAISIKVLLGGFVGVILEFLFVYIINPQVDYSRTTILITSFLLFAISSAVTKIILISPKSTSTSLTQCLPDIQQIVSVQWKNLIREGALYFTPLFSALGTFLVFNHLYFGSAMPLSGRIKAWWGTMDTIYGVLPTYLLPFFGFTSRGPWKMFTGVIEPISNHIHLSFLSPSYTFLLVFAVFALIVVLIYLRTKNLQETIRFFSLESIILGVLFHSSYYTMTGYIGYRRWYWTVEYMILLIFAAIFLDILGKVIVKRNSFLEKKWIKPGITVACLLVLVISFSHWQLKYFPWGPKDESVYLWNVRALEANTPDGSLIGMTGGGVEAYFIQDRTIINMDGLINGEEYYQHLINMRLDEYLEKIGVNYVFGLDQLLLHYHPYKTPLANRLELVENEAIIQDFTGHMRLFRFVPES